MGHPLVTERSRQNKQLRERDVQAIVYHLDPQSQYRQLGQTKHAVVQDRQRSARQARQAQRQHRADVLREAAAVGPQPLPAAGARDSQLDALVSYHAQEYLRDTAHGTTFFSCSLNTAVVELRRFYQPCGAELTGRQRAANCDRACARLPT